MIPAGERIPSGDPSYFLAKYSYKQGNRKKVGATPLREDQSEEGCRSFAIQRFGARGSRPLPVRWPRVFVGRGRTAPCSALGVRGSRCALLGHDIPFSDGFGLLPQLAQNSVASPGPGGASCLAFPPGPGCLLLWARRLVRPLLPSGSGRVAVSLPVRRLRAAGPFRFPPGVCGALPPLGQGFPLLDVGTESPFGAAHPRPGHPSSGCPLVQSDSG